MPLYSYEAVDRDGKKVAAKLDAVDESAVKEQLSEQGLVPLGIKEAGHKASLHLKRVTRKDLLAFTQELGNLLESGLPVDRALYVLSVHSEKENLRKILRQVYIDIQRGQSLSQALSRHDVFPRLYINMIRAGEVGGVLEVSIKRLAGFIETTVEFQEEITSALVYPVLLTAVGGLAVAVLMFFVIPRFAEVLQGMGQALPTPTLVLLSITKIFTTYWWLLAGGTAAAVVLFRSYAATSEGRQFMDGLKLKVPGLRGLNMKLIIARFARTLGTLLQSGVPILESVRVSRDVVDNEIISVKLKKLEEGISKGRGVAGPLQESGVFPPIVSQMIAVGEEAGRLEQTFLSVAERFEGESKSAIKRAVSLIEPALILIMGVIVGFVVISMLIAVFSINEIPL